MLQRPSRVAAIHDLSGFGRCSLSVISPILSVMGIQPVPVPTAVLSTHTGGFHDVVFRDLSDYILPALHQYQAEHLEFECIYTGFLGSQEQIGHCLDFIAAYPNALTLVDPVMGDHGERYKTYTPSMCDCMRQLVKKANVITPNPTEMHLLLGQEYDPRPLPHQKLKTNLLKLSEMGPDTVIVTGVELADMTVNNIGYDRKRGAFWRVKCSYMPVSYPGTGDIFASVVVGSLLKGDSLPIAMERATRFLELAIKRTFSYSTDRRFGVMLEPNLSWLAQEQVLDQYEVF
ncbi:MAG: pyridoxamine kinase [Massiliimalia sp.]